MLGGRISPPSCHAYSQSWLKLIVGLNHSRGSTMPSGRYQDWLTHVIE
jgi:hypothetical protein